MATTEQLRQAVRADKRAFDAVDARFQQVKQQREDARRQLAEVLEEVAQLDRDFERLEPLRKQLLKGLGRSCAMYRRRTLIDFPHELLREFFIHCSNDASRDWYNDDNWSAAYYEPIDFSSRWATLPYRLATVCQKWRTVALDTGCIWAYIATNRDRDERDEAVFLSELDRALTSLARSGSAPLQVHLPWRSLEPYDDSKPRSLGLRVADSLFREISRSAHRLDRVFLGIVPEFVRTMYSIFKSPTPSLSLLFIEEYCNLHPHQVQILTGGLPLATNLRSMELHGSGRLQTAIHCERLSSMHSLRLGGPLHPRSSVTLLDAAHCSA